MKVALLTLALLLSPTAPALAADGTTHQAIGTVKSINAEKGTVSIAHGPVPALKWPPMTMSFSAQDARLLESLKPGAKIEFEFVEQGPRYVITSIK
jgi:Cu/Ag efflux protein CusF